jgi:hypothetical protein
MVASSTWLAGALLLAAPLTASGAEPATGPLAPSGQWVVEGQDNMCALSHAYGEGKARVTLTVRPWPMGGTVDTLLFYPSTDMEPGGGVGSVELAPSGSKLNGLVTSYAVKGRNLRLAALSAPEVTRDDLESAATISVTVDKRRAVSVAQSGAKAAYAALDRCGDLLLKSLNIDPVAMKAVVTPPAPVGAVGSWFKVADYPQAAMAGNAQGATSMLVTVGLDGRVAACVPFGRSGNLDIDKAACSAFTRRGRYTPGLDKDGKPMVSYATQRVRWTLG